MFRDKEQNAKQAILLVQLSMAGHQATMQNNVVTHGDNVFLCHLRRERPHDICG